MSISTKNRAIQELRDRAAGSTREPIQFLKEYWQKKPLLVRRVFAAWWDPVSRDELAGFSCEDDVESRLVLERGGKKPWQVIHGPQRENQLRRLPLSHWTLLVQGVDRLIPGVAALLDPFRFIPDWRVDDVMVSFASRGGTVGPHIDSYDVFLLQGQGRRRWRLDSKAPKELRPGLDLRILKKFHAEEDWILEPGDMLYLPPNVAHYGVALEECLTYSIGFRSPGSMDLLSAVQERMMRAGTSQERYKDPHLRMPEHPGEIPSTALRDLRLLVKRGLDQLNPADFDQLIGELITEPKAAAPDKRSVSVVGIGRQLKKGATLVRSSGSRMGFIRRGTSTAFFVDGQLYVLRPRMAFAAPLLSRDKRIAAENLIPHLKHKEFALLLATLVGVGAFRLEH